EGKLGRLKEVQAKFGDMDMVTMLKDPNVDITDPTTWTTELKDAVINTTEGINAVHFNYTSANKGLIFQIPIIDLALNQFKTYAWSKNLNVMKALVGTLDDVAEEGISGLWKMAEPGSMKKISQLPLEVATEIMLGGIGSVVGYRMFQGFSNIFTGATNSTLKGVANVTKKRNLHQEKGEGAFRVKLLDKATHQLETGIKRVIHDMMAQRAEKLDQSTEEQEVMNKVVNYGALVVLDILDEGVVNSVTNGDWRSRFEPGGVMNIETPFLQIVDLLYQSSKPELVASGKVEKEARDTRALLTHAMLLNFGRAALNYKIEKSNELNDENWSWQDTLADSTVSLLGQEGLKVLNDARTYPINVDIRTGHVREYDGLELMLNLIGVRSADEARYSEAKRRGYNITNWEQNKESDIINTYVSRANKFTIKKLMNQPEVTMSQYNAAADYLKLRNRHEKITEENVYEIQDAILSRLAHAFKDEAINNGFDISYKRFRNAQRRTEKKPFTTSDVHGVLNEQTIKRIKKDGLSPQERLWLKYVQGEVIRDPDEDDNQRKNEIHIQ
ncbi:MAG: hypothetical protein ACOC1L_03985, partial [Bacillota bacterium]